MYVHQCQESTYPAKPKASAINPSLSGISSLIYRCFPVTPPKLLDLLKADGLPASSHQEKATLLQQRFFPNPEASPPPDNALPLNSSINISREVTLEDIQAILSRTALWKALGIDNLPAGFLKACGEPLAKVLAILATKCFKLEWFLKGLKRAKVIVL